ncbi:hypothetical protein NCAST_32_04800 [Nocardia asteroides NBRC 15531]|uniref:Uncharacterized protein n=1 Tax=Nocardia asteroides NBRC 15531 TaxID=1110697 RepID=U5EI11_NOCAS|nr:hypothetical protein NCAST_32_04800 [Nocardia asteroides NBRC 15531]SFM30689.1 hypothetical protein SAMN05444423_102626 [Nocardia asteroides]VEG35843.1 Uncharacterised protein [Nocardia asteroides]
MVSKRRSAIPPLVAATVMVLSVVIALHRGVILTYLWLLALPLLALAFAAVIAGSGLAVWQASPHASRGPLVATAGLALIAIGAPVLFVVRPELGVWLRFQLARPGFAAVAAMDAPSADDGYYGKSLPGHLCWVSANCKVADIGTPEQPVPFVPDYVGIPDGATGYGYFTDAPSAGPYDGFGDPICPRIELPGGWWWLGGCP